MTSSDSLIIYYLPMQRNATHLIQNIPKFIHKELILIFFHIGDSYYLLLNNHVSNITKKWHKISLDEGLSDNTNDGLKKKRYIDFLKFLLLCPGLIVTSIKACCLSSCFFSRNCLTGEQYDPWASCFNFKMRTLIVCHALITFICIFD